MAVVVTSQQQLSFSGKPSENHFSFAISHLSFFISTSVKRPNDRWKMANGKWQMENDKRHQPMCSATCTCWSGWSSRATSRKIISTFGSAWLIRFSTSSIEDTTSFVTRFGRSLTWALMRICFGARCIVNNSTTPNNKKTWLVVSATECSFGHHAGRTRDHGRDELQNRDHSIGKERAEYGQHASSPSDYKIEAPGRLYLCSGLKKT